MKRDVKKISGMQNCILYLLLFMMVFTGTLSGEARVVAELESVQTKGAVYRVIPNVLFEDEACTGNMIGNQTKLPNIRAFRPLRRMVRVFLPEESFLCALGQKLYSTACHWRCELQFPETAQRLTTTIQYIHNLDGEKTVFFPF